MSKNGHIEEFLDYYVGLSVSPEYAVLLTGEWGVGKTWFIKQYLSNRGISHLYITLNGVSSFSEIEDQFFEQLHPVLASKSMKIASKVLKGLLKTAINVDWDGDGRSDASVSSSIPDINLPEYLRNADDKLLVFDDLERSSLAIPNILGYINQFVETKGLKVVILANESEIVRTDQLDSGKEKPYLLIKEKLIGKTFDLLSDPNTAITLFQEQTNNGQIKDILIENTPVVLEVYSSAAYHNLRHLRQAVLDFERFYQYIPDFCNDNQKLVEHIISLYFVISIELRKGYVTLNDLPILLNPFISPKSSSPSPAIGIKSKYLILSNHISPIPDEHWIKFFKTGLVDAEKLSASIQQSSYFEKRNEPDWQKLWRYFELNDEDFVDLRDKLYSEFRLGEGQNSFVIIQETGIFLRLVKQRLLDSTEDEVIEFGQSNLRYCRENVGLPVPKPFEEYPSTTSHGLQYLSLENPRFQDFLNFARELMTEFVAENANNSVVNLLDTLKMSVADFNDLIRISNTGLGIHKHSGTSQYRDR